MTIIEKNGKFYITDSRGRVRSSAFDDRDDAEDTLDQWRAEAAEEAAQREDTPCIDLSQYHGPHNG